MTIWLEKIRRAFLSGFRKIRRPTGWVVLGAGIAGFIATILQLIVTGDAYWVTLVGFLLFANDGFQMIQEEEDE